jgi:hypothetical protein
MSGMLIDTLAYQFMETYEHRSKSFLYHDYMARDFFDFLSKKDPDLVARAWQRRVGREEGHTGKGRPEKSSSGLSDLLEKVAYWWPTEHP